MRMIAGLEQPTKGAISIGDRTVSGPGVFVPTCRRRLGMVFQSYAVWPHKTVRENVAFPLRQQGVSRADQKRRVERVLEQVGLGSYSERYPSQRSEEHTSELQSLMRISYAVFCLKKKNTTQHQLHITNINTKH